MSGIYLWERTKRWLFVLPNASWPFFAFLITYLPSPSKLKKLGFPCNEILSKKFFNENCRFYLQLYPNFWGFSSNATMTRKSMAVQLSPATTLKRTCDWNARLEWLKGLSPPSADSFCFQKMNFIILSLPGVDLRARFQDWTRSSNPKYLKFRRQTKKDISPDGHLSGNLNECKHTLILTNISLTI